MIHDDVVITDHAAYTAVVERALAADISAVVQLHMKAFKGFFLTFLGAGFLNLMYRCYLTQSDSGILVARNQREEVIGFLAYSSDVSAFYKSLLRKHLLPFAWFALIGFIRRPSSFMRLVGALRAPQAFKRNEPYIEVTSIAVDPETENKGVGTRLLRTLIDQADFGRFAYVNLETDADDNTKANAFYRRNGFVLSRTFTKAHGRVMNEYRYAPGGSKENNKT